VLLSIDFVNNDIVNKYQPANNYYKHDDDNTSNNNNNKTINDYVVVGSTSSNSCRDYSLQKHSITAARCEMGARVTA